MASYKVILPLRHQGKTYGADDSITLNKDAAERYTNLGYIKAEGAKAAAKKSGKAASKKATTKTAKAGKKGSDTVTIEPTGDAAE